MVNPGLFFKAQTEPDEEMMGEKRHGHVMVPPPPTPGLVVVHPQLAFAFFEGHLDRPAPPTHPDQGPLRGSLRRIARV